MFGSIDNYKTGAGTRYRARWTDASGRKQSQGGFLAHADAKAHLRDLIGKKKGGVKKNVAWLIDEFLADKYASVSAGSLVRGTYEDYAFVLRRWVLSDALAKTNLSELDTPAINAFLKRLVARASSSACKRARTHISVMLTWAVGAGLMLINPAREARLEQSKRRVVALDDFDLIDVHDLKIPNQEQVREIISAADVFDASGMAGAQMRLLFYAGLRASEMLGFPVKAAKLRPDGRMRLKIVQRAEHHHGEIGAVKSDASIRELMLAQGPALHLRKYMLAAGLRDGLLFPTRNGNAWLYRNWHRRVWKPILTKAGCDGFSPHDARHFAVSALIAAGAAPKRIQQFAGHASMQLTMDTYGHLLPQTETDDALADAVAAQVG